MSGWIRFDLATPDHPKVGRLARRLKVSRAAALGHMVALWRFTATYAWETGDLSAQEQEDIAEGAMWEGDPTEFVEALKGARLLDDDMTTHSWEAYQAAFIAQRRNQASAVEGRKRLCALRRELKAAEKRGDAAEADRLRAQLADPEASQLDSRHASQPADPEASQPEGRPASQPEGRPASQLADPPHSGTRSEKIRGDKRRSEKKIGSRSPSPPRGAPSGESPPTVSEPRSRKPLAAATAHPQAEELVAEYEALSGTKRSGPTLGLASKTLHEYGPARLRVAYAAYRRLLEAEPDRPRISCRNWFGQHQRWLEYDGLDSPEPTNGPGAEPATPGAPPAVDRARVLAAIRATAESGRDTWRGEARMQVQRIANPSRNERESLLDEAARRAKAGNWDNLDRPLPDDGRTDA